MSQSFQGETALVTGASRGIGQGIAYALGEQGAAVLGTATTPEGAEQITAAFREKGIHGKGYSLDVSDPIAMTSKFLEMSQEFESPSILVNNAGITRDTLMLRMMPDQWNQVLATNLSGVFYLTQACLKPMLKRRWGRIINMSSVAGVTGNPGQANYVAAKAGLIGLTKTIALEFASRGITANCIAPGFIETEMSQRLSDKQKETILSHIPMRRMGAVSEIVHAVLYLSGKEAGYITGETLHINGGMYMV